MPRNESVPSGLNKIFTRPAGFLISPGLNLLRGWLQVYERSYLSGSHRRFLRGEQALRQLVRKTLGAAMENLFVGLIALALFAYLLIAMLYPEKF